MANPEDFLRDDPAKALLGRVIQDRYRVEKILGEGATGWVFQAEHTVMGHKVALKVLRDTAAQNRQMVERFISEARTSSQLREPHTVRVFDFGATEDGYLFIAMEMLVGQALADLLEDEPVLPAERVAHITRQICLALSEAHDMGLVHRDLKPENIYLIDVKGEPDFVKVLDFGIAKFVAGETPVPTKKLTELGATLGTPWYMSPEQACALELDHKSDLYSLGVMMFEMLTGDLPFDADTGMKVLMAHVNDDPPEVPEVVDGNVIPLQMRELVGQLLSKKPSERPASAEDIAKKLKRMASRWTNPNVTVPEVAALATAATVERSETSVAPEAPTQHEVPAAPQPAIPTPLPGSQSAFIPQPRRGGRTALIAILVVAVLGLGAAAAYFAMQAGKNGEATPPTARGNVADLAEQARAEQDDPESGDPQVDEGTEVPPGPADTEAAVGDDVAAAGGPDGHATEAADAKEAPSTDVEAAGETAAGEDGGGEPIVFTEVAKRKRVEASKKSSLSKGEIVKVLKKNQGKLLKCLKVIHGGKVSTKVRMTIAGSGKVTAVKVTPPTGGFGECVQRQLKTVRFPEHDQKSIIYSFPLGT